MDGNGNDNMIGDTGRAGRVAWDQGTFRAAIGYLGMALPFILAIGGLVFYPHDGFLDGLATSISGYYHFGAAASGYHPAMRDVFVGLLFLIGLSLIYYRGYEKRDEPFSDDVVASVAGFSAIAVALVPTDDALPLTADVTGGFHLAFATLFFAALVYFCWCIFTRTGNGQMTPGKRARNRIYRLCAILIAGALVAIAAVSLLGLDEYRDTYKAVFWLESIAVVAFGFSWLVKANTLPAVLLSGALLGGK